MLKSSSVQQLGAFQIAVLSGEKTTGREINKSIQLSYNGLEGSPVPRNLAVKHEESGGRIERQRQGLKTAEVI